MTLQQQKETIIPQSQSQPGFISSSEDRETSRLSR
jgi:hypothetical protein